VSSAFLVLATAHGLGEVAEKLGVIAVAVLAALAVLGGADAPDAAAVGVGRVRVGRRGRAVAMLAALVLTPVLLLADIWHTSQLTHLRHHPAEAAAAVVLGVAVVLALALLIRRRPRALPLLAVFALPFRLPIATGGGTSNLLIPLYLVIGAGVLASSLPHLRGGIASERPSADRAGGGGSPWRRLLTPRGVEWLLLASVVLYGLQASYSADFSKALEDMTFFYVPFALLFALLREVRWTRELLLQCLAVAVALAVVFAGIGFVEYHRKQLFLNPRVVAANEYSNYFRVNSLFFDPSIYGRFLALVMVAVTAGVLWSARRRTVLVGGAILLWLLAGLITSFSQSSIAALLLGLAVLAAYRWDVRGTLYVSGALLAVALVVVLLAPPSLHLGVSGRGSSASSATSGRTKLVGGGLALFADRPLQGFGPGSFAPEYRSHEHVESASATSASHTIPITVAAEQGVVGLALYVALLISTFAVLFRGAGRSPPDLLAGDAQPGCSPGVMKSRHAALGCSPGAMESRHAALGGSPGAAGGGLVSPFRPALAACWAALVLHTFTYADFLEDPETWVLLAIGLALACAPRAASELGQRARRAAPVTLRS
jgi:O-antigen ligase